jgi:membrane fusion protein, heavy metal efflux system
MFVIALGCVAGLLIGCSREEKPTAPPTPSVATEASPALIVIPPDSPMLRQIRVEPVQTAALPTEEVIVPGKIEVNPNRVSHVVMPVAGRVASVLVKLGDAVTESQPLLAIQSPDADTAMASYLQAEASVTQAKAALAKARADFDRLDDLYAHKAVAKKDVLDANNGLTQTKAALEQAQAAREQMVRRLELLGLKPGGFQQQVIVRAPLAGKVLEINVAPGEYRNDISASLMTVADLSTVWVASDVPESYIRFVDVGERVEINLVAYPGETFEGWVMRIADTVDPQTRTVKVRAEMENPHGRFRPEMYGSIHHIDSTQLFPVLPVGAVIQGDGHSVVFVEQSPGHFLQTEVTVGKRAGDVAPLLSGAHAGDRVVVDGAMLLKGLKRNA